MKSTMVCLSVLIAFFAGAVFAVGGFLLWASLLGPSLPPARQSPELKKVIEQQKKMDKQGHWRRAD